MAEADVLRGFVDCFLKEKHEKIFQDTSKTFLFCEAFLNITENEKLQNIFKA